MIKLYAHDGANKSRLIRLSGIIAQGAVGTIHKVVGETGVLAKRYKDPNERVQYQEKIAAMLAASPNLPPVDHHGRACVQIAWPTAQILDDQGAFCGFLMPEVDFHASTELENILQRAARQRKQLPEFYGHRVWLAGNLSSLVSELHSLGHFLVDMKPMNIRFYPDALYLAILDTDGFSINGSSRYPARHFADEYIAPEAKGSRPEQLGLEQDLFALAVIIFRLLNNGLHPYQGIDRGNHPTGLQERIFAGLYAYGLKPHREVRPAPSSIHEYLEQSTREMFDRAFQQGRTRPTAPEWRDHLRDLNKILARCAAQPSDHAHFSKGCGLCSLEKKRRTAQASAKAPRSPRKVHAPLSSGNVLTPLPTKQTTTPFSKAKYAWDTIKEYAALIVIGAFVLYYNLVPATYQGSKPPVSLPSPKDTSRFPEPYPTAAPPVAPREALDEGTATQTLRYGDLSVNVYEQSTAEGIAGVVTGNFGGRPVFSLRTDPHPGGIDPTAKVIQLDTRTRLPQVVIWDSTGGNGCCTETWIATADWAGNWHTIKLESLDEGYQIMDIDGDGTNELVSVDSSFINAFASHAGSLAPPKIQKLVGLELSDVTHEPGYQNFLRQELKRMESLWPKVSYEKNGYLGAWVATKALVDESSDAWKIMLTKYDRNSEWTMGDCLSGAAFCPENERRRVDFPEALLSLLIKNHYVDPATANFAAQLATGSTQTPPPNGSSGSACMLPFCLGKRLIGALH